MANELVHGTVGVSMTQAEFEAVGLHVCNSQATGDLIYASSATQLTRLAAGAQNTILVMGASIPAWSATLSGLTFVAPALGAATATSINGLIITTTAGTLTIANNASAALVTSGNYSITLTATAATSITLPTTGTLATLAGTEELDSKTLDSSVLKGTFTASGTVTIPAITMGGNIALNGKYLSGDGDNEGVYVTAAGIVCMNTTLGANPWTSFIVQALANTITGMQGVTFGEEGHFDGAVTITDGQTAQDGTIAARNEWTFRHGTMAATNTGITVTDAATVYITNRPTAGTNVTISNGWALWVDAGNVRFDGNLNLNGSVLQVSGTQVVSAQGAAVADVSDGLLATTITQLNALLARVRTHGLIAT